MDFLKPGPEFAHDALRAMTMVARAADSGLARPQKAMLAAAQELVLETDFDVETLPPITLEELKRHCDDPSQARQLVRMMVMISLADGPPSHEEMRLLRSFAAALNVHEPAVRVIGHLARHRLLRFRLAFARRSHIRIYLRNTYRLLEGVVPLVKAILRMRGVIGEDTRLASRFHALGDLPEDSLGHHFYRHCQDAGLPFSGEKGGFPIGALYHDFTHVLAGYDTSPKGEMKAAAFQAGFTKHDADFFTALFAIVIHTAGVNLAPFPMPVLLGRIGEGNLAADVLRALQRGASMNVDLGSDWDFWEYVDLPIEVVRERLGVPPLSTA
jgi:tellurite resistance protein/ubiquinone biosynthesis protein Coq4